VTGAITSDWCNN